MPTEVTLIHTDLQPGRRSGHRMVATATKIFLFGGYRPVDVLYKEVWEYDIITNTWSMLETDGDPPNCVASASMIIDGDTLMVFGGSGLPFGRCNSNILHTLNLKEKIWRKIQCKNATPSPRYGQSMIKGNDGYIYIFGGTAGLTFHDDLYRFRRKDYVFERMPHVVNTPSERYRHEVVGDEECFYILGGATLGSYMSFEEIHSFHYDSLQWKSHKCIPSISFDFPEPRCCHGCVLFNKRIYMCGGFNERTAFDDFWVLDVINFQWSKLDITLPDAMFFHAIALQRSLRSDNSSGCLFIHGGCIPNDETREVTRSSSFLRCWLTVPSLQECTVNSITRAIRTNFHTPATKSMLQLHLPNHLIGHFNKAWHMYQGKARWKEYETH